MAAATAALDAVDANFFLEVVEVVVGASSEAAAAAEASVTDMPIVCQQLPASLAAD